LSGQWFDVLSGMSNLKPLLPPHFILELKDICALL
jgi:hypothetical protein